MVNATEMAKPFGKRPTDWFKNQSTQDFITELSNVRNLPFETLTHSKGGAPENGGGTWMHEDVALEFARWLSPAFAIWCNDRIKELMTTGVATIANDDEAILHAMQVLQKRVEQGKQKLIEAQNVIAEQTTTIQHQNKQIEKLQKDSDYLSLILTSDSSIAVTQIAQDYGMSAKAFNQQLHTMRIQHKVNGQWILYAPHQGKSYIKSRTIDFLNSKGERKTRIHTEWTQRGRIFLYHALAEIGILPLIEQAA